MSNARTNFDMLKNLPHLLVDDFGLIMHISSVNTVNCNIIDKNEICSFSVGQTVREMVLLFETRETCEAQLKKIIKYLENNRRF